MKKFGMFLLTKDANAAAVAFFCALLSVFYIPVGFVAAIIIGLVTLQKGTKSGFWVLAWAVLPTLALLVLHRIGPFDLLFMRCVIIWLFAAFFRRYPAWHIVLESAAVFGAVAVLSLHFFVMDLQHWWTTELTNYIQQLIADSHWKLGMEPSEFASRLSPMASGLVAFFFMMTVFVELLMARWWQSQLTDTSIFPKEFTQIRISLVGILLVVVLMSLSFFKIHAAEDALPIAILPFFIAGLSLMHFGVGQNRKLFFWLVLIYVLLMFLPAVVILLLTILAMIDTFVDFRKRILNKS